MFTTRVQNIQIREHSRVFQITSAIVATLRFFCLERVSQDRNGSYTFNNIKLKSIILVLISLIFPVATTLLWFVFSSKVDIYKNTILTLLTNYLSSFIWFTHYIFYMTTLNIQSEDKWRVYYNSLQEFDDILFQCNKSDVYKKDNRRSLLIFFSFLAVLLIIFTYQSYMYMVYFWVFALDCFLCVGYYVIRFLVSMVIADYLVKVHLCRTRVIALELRLLEIVNPSWVRVVRLDGSELTTQTREKDQTGDMMACFCSLREHCDIINFRYGFQMALFNASTIVTTIGAVDTFIIWQNNALEETIPNSESGFMDGLMVHIIDVLIFNVVYVWIIECVMSIERHYKEILLIAENASVSTRMSEQQRSKWAKLAALCRRLPIEFTACGFFKLNYSLLATMLGTMVTYAVMLVQLKK